MSKVHLHSRMDIATVARARVTRADGRVEDHGVLSVDLCWWKPKQWWRVAGNIVRFGWRTH